MSEMTGIQPTMDITGNGNNGFGNTGWGALIGGAIGGAFGSGWGNWRGGNVQPVQNNNDQFIMDSITTMRNSMDSIGRDAMLQNSALQTAISNGVASVNAGIAGLGSDLGRGQTSLEGAVYSTALQGQLGAKDNLIANLTASHANAMQSMQSSFDLLSSQKDCCCSTNRNIENQGCETRSLVQSEMCATRDAIHSDGESTRALVSQLDRERLLRESTMKDARIAQLEAQTFNASLAAQQQSTLASMSNVLTEILQKVSTTTTQTA